MCVFLIGIYGTLAALLLLLFVLRFGSLTLLHSAAAEEVRCPGLGCAKGQGFGWLYNALVGKLYFCFHS